MTLTIVNATSNCFGPLAAVPRGGALHAARIHGIGLDGGQPVVHAAATTVAASPGFDHTNYGVVDADSWPCGPGAVRVLRLCIGLPLTL